MCLAKVEVPEGRGDIDANSAFAARISTVSRRRATSEHADRKRKKKADVDLETSALKAKHFIDKLLISDFGFPKTRRENQIAMRLLAFFVNFLTIIVSSLAVFLLTGVVNHWAVQIKN